MRFALQSCSSAWIEQQYFTWSAAPESTVKGHQRRPGAGAETGEVSICPEVRTYLTRPGSSPPDTFKTVRFCCVPHPGIAFKCFSDLPRRSCRQWMIIHHMRIGEQPQQAHFSHPAEYKQSLALRLKSAFGRRVVRVRVHRQINPDVDIRQVDHQSQRPLALASSPSACGPEAASSSLPPSEVLR